MKKDNKRVQDAILNKSKQSYNQIPVPKELHNRVNEMFHEYEQKEKEMGSMKNTMDDTTNTKETGKPKKILVRIGVGIAACFAVFVIGLNTSETFAKGAEKIPVVGTIARVLTVRTYEDTNEDRTIRADVAQIEVETDNEKVKEAVADLNKEIGELVDEHIKLANQHIAEYKEAFIATGGTEEEFTEKGIVANVSHEIKTETNEMVSIVITSYENWASAYTEQFFYTLDLTTGDVLTLKDILGDGYIEKANKAIREEMEQRVNAGENIMYFTEEEGGFVSVDENVNFYVNEDGNPVVVFEKYEVAPGFMGIQEFEIAK
ncbi:RsiV family protein [Anaerosporobacter sp.]|uniref:RsiV family protein n=1 Tax=Anaerosporobacter sp. TaxID=1872529 RepID=UPI00286F3EEF|nr:RsiV family protein [Anaerosporobacter sp.]